MVQLQPLRGKCVAGRACERMGASSCWLSGKLVCLRLISSWWLVSGGWDYRGFAAIGFLVTLPPKRGNDAARGSLLRRELPTGLRDGDGSGPQGLFSFPRS